MVRRLKRRIEAVGRDPRRWLRLLRYELGTFGGREDYTRFAVVTRSRTGSNLLTSILDAHPKIRMDGEILRRVEGRAVDRVVARLFRPHPRTIDAVGFKYFYYHPVDGDPSTAWDEIDRCGCRVLHLRRENLLRTEISRLIANKVGVWSRRRGKEDPLESRRVTVQPAAVVRALEKTRSWERAARERWEGGNYIELSYEELTSHPGPTLRRIHTFLGVPDHPADSSLKRQNPEPIHRLVANYDELCAALEKTEWAYLLRSETDHT